MIPVITAVHVSSGLKKREKEKKAARSFGKNQKSQRRAKEDDNITSYRSGMSLQEEDAEIVPADPLIKQGVESSYEYEGGSELHIGHAYPSQSTLRNLGMHHVKKYDNYSHLEKYREVQRRTKLLYGVADVKFLIDKSPDSINLFKEQIKDDDDMIPSVNKSSNENQRPEKFSLKKLLVIDNFIISQNSEWKIIFDNLLLIVIGYTCLTTVLFVSFQLEQTSLLKAIDIGVTISFAADFIFNFFLEYQDKETFQRVRDPKKIALKYFYSGWMMADFVATFPFQLFLGDFIYTKLIRLLRLTKLATLIDISRIKRMIKSYYENSQRADRAQSQYLVMFTYRIFRLITIVFMITYFIGCGWYLTCRYINSTKDEEDGNTFIKKFGLDELRVDTGICGADECAAFIQKCKTNFDQEECTENNFFTSAASIDCGSIDSEYILKRQKVCCDHDLWRVNNCQDVLTQVVIVSYFSLTTLSTVGYGDLFPISRREMLLGIIFMLIGIVFFSQIMGSFIEIIQEYDQRMGQDDKGSELNNWMTLLTRFTNKPLSKTLINQIDKHFSFYWANDRLKAITKDDEYLNQCPQAVRRHMILNYLFDDVIYKFRAFFFTVENMDSKFLYDVCFDIKPAKFDLTEHDQLILDEENEVTEMYFIQEGTVGIGYYLMTQGLTKKQFKIGIELGQYSYICDYYICFNKKSEFIYMTMANIKAMTLRKEFLQDKIFPKYPSIAANIKQRSETRYKKNVRSKLLNQRQKHIMEINKQSPYKQINIQEKNYQEANQDTHDNEWYSKQNSRRSFGDHTPKGSIGSTPIPNDKSKDKSESAAGQGQKQITSQAGLTGYSTGANTKTTPNSSRGLYPKSGNSKITQISKNETDIPRLLRHRLEQISCEMNDFNNDVQKFSVDADHGLGNLVRNMEMLQKNLSRVHNGGTDDTKKEMHQTARSDQKGKFNFNNNKK